MGAKTELPRKRAIGPDVVFVDARPQLDGSVVKSAQRVIQLLELFSDVRIGITVADVASKLKMPQSSTSALLRSLHTLGYLAIDEEKRTYAPTSRVALLGHWIDPLLLREGPILQMTRAVSEEAGYDTFLAIRNKLHVQIVYRQHSAGMISHSLTGAGSFMTLAATGHALMCDMSEREVTKLVTATNARLPDGVPPVSTRELFDKLAAVRREGFAIGPAMRSQNNMTVAVRLPDTTVEPMVIGISVPSESLGDDPHVWSNILKNAVRHWLGEG